jgi:S-adenosylmethionine synthetase
MTLEAAPGKNPVSHVGKLYHVAATRIAAAIASHVPGIADVSCVLVSQIGHPIDDPRLAAIRIAFEPGQHIDAVRAAVRDVVFAELAQFSQIGEALLQGHIRVY